MTWPFIQLNPTRPAAAGKTGLDLELGWRVVPGFFDTADGETLQTAVRSAPVRTAVIELGAWCGRSLAAICEVLPAGVVVCSYDNYLEDSQADQEETAIRPKGAMLMRAGVAAFHAARGRDVVTFVLDSISAGQTYTGPPVSVMLIDDHHSEEQIEGNLRAWWPHFATEVVLLFHDYYHSPYGIASTCEVVLPGAGFGFVGSHGGLGVWARAAKP